MYRRVLMRRQISFLLHCIRLFYGALLLNLVVISLCHHKSVLAQVTSLSGAYGAILIMGMSISASLLVLETVTICTWDLINSEQLNQFYLQHPKLNLLIQRTRIRVRNFCACVNRRRHWFYLPPALACLSVIPMSYKFNINEAAAVHWFYLCLCFAGIGFAILEGIISNDRVRYA